jgi:hypothetical protein
MFWTLQMCSCHGMIYAAGLSVAPVLGQGLEMILQQWQDWLPEQ